MLQVVKLGMENYTPSVLVSVQLCARQTKSTLARWSFYFLHPTTGKYKYTNLTAQAVWKRACNNVINKRRKTPSNPAGIFTETLPSTCCIFSEEYNIHFFTCAAQEAQEFACQVPTSCSYSFQLISLYTETCLQYQNQIIIYFIMIQKYPNQTLVKTRKNAIVEYLDYTRYPLLS